MNAQEPFERKTAPDLQTGMPLPEHGGGHDRGLINAFCITLYNEDLETLCATIRSIVLSREEEGSSTPLPQSTICVVADGADRLDKQILQAFTAGGVRVADPRVVDEVEIHSSEHSAAQLLSLLGLNAEPGVFVHRRFNFIFCLKRKNRGKLHSHEVFFNIVCPDLNPTFCYQLDAGSILAPDAAAILTARLLDDPSIGALAPRVTPPIPGRFSGMLEAWQYHDFALRQAVVMPLEGDLDFLGCVPGQASVFRWSALSSPLDANGRPSERSPVWAYLFGIANGNPLRPLMYLSEDRVVGNALVLDSPDAWKLKFSVKAAAVTDACQTLRELLLQRRRWTNSAMICRMWLLGRWSGIVRHSSRPTALKIRQSLSVVMQLLVGLREFSSPAQFVAVLYLIYQMGASAPSTSAPLLAACFFLVVGMEIGVHVYSLWTKSTQRKRIADRIGTLLAWASVPLWISTVIVSLPPRAIAIVLGSAFLVYVCMILTLPARGLLLLLRSQFAPVQHLLFANVIMTYSLWNMHDASWGTKGLTKSTNSPRESSHLRRFKLTILSAFVAANALLIYATVRAPGLIYADLNPLLEMTYAAEFIIVAVTLLRLLSTRLWPSRNASKGLARRRSTAE